MQGNAKHIMVVDDVAEVLEGIASILMANDFSVTKAENGIDALNKIDETVDLVVTDILMPEMDGIELCQEIRKRFADVKLILISGGGRQSALKKDYDYLNIAKKLTGVETILKKPFDPEELIRQIKSQLD